MKFLIAFMTMFIMTSYVCMSDVIKSNVGARDVVHVENEETPPLPDDVVAVEWIG